MISLVMISEEKKRKFISSNNRSKQYNRKKLLRKSYQDKKDAVVADVPKEAEECEEENTKASLAIKLTHELIGEAKHDAAAAKALYIIRDLVK